MDYKIDISDVKFYDFKKPDRKKSDTELEAFILYLNVIYRR
jgi:hypothetical protein